MQRREFLKGSCKICLLGVAGFALVIESCSPKMNTGIEKAKPIISNGNMASVPVSMFAADKKYTIISVEKYPFEIAVERKEDNTFKALLLMCTHQDNALTPTGSGYTCNVHGSKFTKEGKVLNGPADVALHELKTTLEQNYLIIHLEQF